MFVTANIYWVLLCARHYAKCFTCIVSFNPHNKSCVFPTKKKKEKKKEEKKSKKERKGVESGERGTILLWIRWLLSHCVEKTPSSPTSYFLEGVSHLIVRQIH